MVKLNHQIIFSLVCMVALAGLALGWDKTTVDPHTQINGSDVPDMFIDVTAKTLIHESDNISTGFPKAILMLLWLGVFVVIIGILKFANRRRNRRGKGR